MDHPCVICGRLAKHDAEPGARHETDKGKSDLPGTSGDGAVGLDAEGAVWSIHGRGEARDDDRRGGKAGGCGGGVSVLYARSECDGEFDRDEWWGVVDDGEVLRVGLGDRGAPVDGFLRQLNLDIHEHWDMKYLVRQHALLVSQTRRGHRQGMNATASAHAKQSTQSMGLACSRAEFLPPR